VRSYAIGDIHGQLGQLHEAHHLIALDRARTGDETAPVIHLGDLVDRGPDSAGVIDRLMQAQADDDRVIVLKGNHDNLFSLFLDDPQARDPRLRARFSWLHPDVGGGATLTSYGVHAPADRPLAGVHADALRAVPDAHRRWLAALPHHYRHGDAFFAHAGIRPGIALHLQDPADLLWIRHDFLDDGRDHGALIVHGHTSVSEATHCGNRLNLDSGAAWGRQLTAAVIEGRDAFALTPRGRVPLPPSSPRERDR